MSPRLKLRVATPLVLAGALWSSTVIAPLTQAGGPCQPPCQTPPPCGPDGVCLPKYDTYGHYQTHWRPFPGDLLSKAPTKAEQKSEAGKDNLSGPQPPPPSQEGEIGKPRPTRGGAAEGGEEPPEPEAGLTPGPATTPAPGPATPEGLPAIPGGTGLPGTMTPEGGAIPGPGAGAAPAGPGALGPEIGAPGAAAPAATPGGAEPGAAPQEKAPAPPTPEEKLVDPFGAAPPTPPAWLRNAAAQRAHAEIKPQPLPALQTTGIFQPAGVMTVVTPTAGFNPPIHDAQRAIFEAPNLDGDDAPPSLPTGLQGLTAAAVTRSSAAAPNALEPARPSQVIPASAEQPQPMPGAAIAVEATDGQLQQAIYFEASDQ